MEVLFVIAFILAWLGLGLLGCHLGRQRFRLEFGDYRHVEWGDPVCIVTTLFGPMGLISVLIFLSFERN